jgi:hypothetical protein
MTGSTPTPENIEFLQRITNKSGNEPVENVMELVVPTSTNVDDLLESNLTWLLQAVSQSVEANSKELLPVSNTTLTDWGGVPTLIFPNHLKRNSQHKLPR